GIRLRPPAGTRQRPVHFHAFNRKRPAPSRGVVPSSKETHMFRRTFLAALVAGIAGISALPSTAEAQQYPDKPIRLVLPFPPGGVTDALARTMADKLGPRLGQPVVVENKPGAGTMLASEAVARTPADGYTLMMAASSLGMAPAIFPKVN